MKSKHSAHIKSKRMSVLKCGGKNNERILRLGALINRLRLMDVNIPNLKGCVCEVEEKLFLKLKGEELSR